jgi:CheY-like chemotaxis protein
MPAANRTIWAEDEPSDRLLIRSALDDLAFKPEVQFVEDGRELLEAIDRERPSRVVLDLNMPRLSGHEALKVLRADPVLAGLPVAVFTGLDDPRLMQQCRSLGVNPYVNKPLDLQAYASGVRRVLGIATN